MLNQPNHRRAHSSASTNSANAASVRDIAKWHAKEFAANAIRAAPQADTLVPTSTPAGNVDMRITTDRAADRLPEFLATKQK